MPKGRVAPGKVWPSPPVPMKTLTSAVLLRRGLRERGAVAQDGGGDGRGGKGEA
jgi:hypothetical protein